MAAFLTISGQRTGFFLVSVLPFSATFAVSPRTSCARTRRARSVDVASQVCGQQETKDFKLLCCRYDPVETALLTYSIEKRIVARLVVSSLRNLFILTQKQFHQAILNNPVLSIS